MIFILCTTLLVKKKRILWARACVAYECLFWGLSDKRQLPQICP